MWKIIRFYVSAFRKGLIQSVGVLFLRSKVAIGKNCTIHKSSKFGVNVHIGDYVIIKQDVTLGNHVIIGNNVTISNITIGDGTHIESGVKITGYGEGKIIIGEQCYIGINNILDWSDSIKIGDYVHIAGPSTGLWTHSSVKQCLNGLPLINKDKNYRPTAPIIIENNVYIGGNCTIYPGIKIGHHSIVAPNSAVNKDVHPNTVVGGVPARLIKKSDF